MKRRSSHRASALAFGLLTALLLGASSPQTQAQTPAQGSNNADSAARSTGDILFTSLVAQARPNRRAGFALTPPISYANASGPLFSIAPVAAGPSLQVLGSGTIGRLPKWTGLTSSNSFIGDSSIFEDRFGKVGVGTDTPTSKLTVLGLIETKGAGAGVKFADGTVQTTAGIAPNQVVRSLNGLKGDLQLAAGANITVTAAGNTLTVAAPDALTAVAHDATLTGDGTAASPLSVVQSNPADQPFQITLDPLVPGSVFTVPAGKRLVIEYVGAFYSVPTAASQQPLDSIEIRTQIGSAMVGHIVLSHRISIDTTGFSIYHVGQNVRLYADPGTQVTPGGFPFNTGTASLTLSGHFVNVP